MTAGVGTDVNLNIEVMRYLRQLDHRLRFQVATAFLPACLLQHMLAQQQARFHCVTLAHTHTYQNSHKRAH